MARVTRKEIKIIGYSLRLPESDNPHEFHENLLNKINMVTKDERRWPPGYAETPEYFGKLKQSLDYFDNIFFGIHGKQAEKLDPQLRLLLETSFESLIDAAVFPEEIKGSSAGVYVGVTFSDAHRYYMSDKENITGYEHTGCAASMHANRLSYFYDLHGPSYCVDSACTSSLTALHCAMNDLQSGKCELALVCGSSIFLEPAVTLAFNRLKMLSTDGFCKTFDKSANGYTRAEGIVSILLTKNPKFIKYTPHANILASDINTCGYHEKGISYPSHLMQADLYKQITTKAKITPKDVKYIECHGTGTVAGDTEEINGIKKFFGEQSKMIIGAVKASMGHAEGASGLAGIAKVLLSYETRVLYPQLHLKNKISDLNNLTVLTEPMHWKGGKAIINSFGFGGANASVLIEKPANKSKIQKKWHNLYFISSRTREGVYQLKRELEKNPIQIPVFNDPLYPWREVVGIPDDPQIEKMEARPIYFIFSGNGSQWHGMGLELAKASPLFKQVLTKCGKDIPALLKKKWLGPLNATRLLVAIQIGLLELVKSFGIKPNGYVGYSAGEIAASYASGATNIKQTMAIAQARGKAAEDMPDGLMISVGLSEKDAQSIIANFDKVCIACINSPRNVTLSGDKQQLQTIMQQLIKEEKFVRELNTENKPYHSLLIDINNVKSHLKNTYKGSTKRNASWICAINDYNPLKFTTDYHVESVVRPVDFLGAMQKVPANAIAIEIGPHAALRSLIRDCAPTVKYVPLMIKDSNDLETFKHGIGRLWTLGTNIKIEQDPVRPPLALRAKSVSWEREFFPVPRDNYKEKKYKRVFTFDLKGKDAYLLGHTIDGKAIFPATGYIYVMWQCYLQDYPNCKIVTLDDFKILRNVPLIGDKIKIEVISPSSNQYELNFNNEVVAVAKLGDKETPATIPPMHLFNKEDTINAPTFYRLCHNDGYEYKNDFQVIKQAFIPDDTGYLYAQINFKEWISFLDGLLQIYLLRKPTKGLRLPTFIRHIELSKNKDQSAVLNGYVNSIQCGEIVIKGLETTLVNRKLQDEIVIYQKEERLLLGHNKIQDDKKTSLIQFFEKCLSVVRENSNFKMNLFEIGTGTGGFLNQIGQCLLSQDYITCTDISENLMNLNENLQHLNINYQHFDLNQKMSASIKDIISKANVIIACNTLHFSKNIKECLQQLYDVMRPGAFILLSEIKSSKLISQLSMDFDENENEAEDTPWEKLFEAVKFQPITYLTDKHQEISVYLIRKQFLESYEILSAPTIEYNEAFANHIKNSSGPFIFHSNMMDGTAGFSRTLTREGKRALHLYASESDQLIDQVKSYGLATNIIEDNKHYTLCYIPQSPKATMDSDSHYHIEFKDTGNLDHYKFVRNKPHPGKLCQVEYAALNFRDVMLASGRISKESYLGYSKESSGVGIEFSGICDGKRVMGVALDAIANFVNTNIYWEIPDYIDLAAAATIPVAYLTVYYSFFVRNNIHKNHKILIHGGTGAVGQAAIRVALDVGCEVFTTCQQSKREYLKSIFPTLDDDHIADSRSTQFEHQVMEKTHGLGVDILLNSLADDKLQAGLNCLAQHGVFIEIGKYDIMRNSALGMKLLLANTTICGIDVDQVFNDDIIMEKLAGLMLDGLKKGVVQPLDHKIFNLSELSDAFRFLGSGKHLGKVLLDMRQPITAAVENKFYTSGAHLIIGGLGGFGMALAEWLVARGAEHLILVNRKGVTNGEQKLFLQKLSAKKIKVEIIPCDLTQMSAAKELIEKLPPLTGIYHLALVLNDTLFNDMSKSKWEETVNAKVLIAKHLDQLTRQKQVKHFVCFSSIASHGNPGQANYAFANNYLENICYSRHRAGYPAHAIQWGAVGNVGVVANQDAKLTTILNKNLGIGLQSIDSCLAYLETCLLSENVVHFVFQSYKEKTEQSLSKTDVIDTISQVLRMDLRKVPSATNLVALGMDSLQSAEIQSIISHVTQDVIPITELAKMTIEDLLTKYSKYTESTSKSITPTKGSSINVMPPEVNQNQTQKEKMDVNHPNEDIINKLTIPS
jgi:fatty acid synthase